ncbi:transcription initiation factor TFIID subunit 2, partial [Thraustotheca clavata]
VHTASSVHLSKSNKESKQPYPTTSILAFFEGYLNSRYPFETYQQIFVEDPPEECQYFAGAAILDQQALYGPTIIDRKLPSHLLQVKAFVGSWIAGAVGIRSTKDAWVLIGVVGHLVNAYVRVVFGEEECGYRIQLAMDALTIIELTTDTAPPRLIYLDTEVYNEYNPSYVPFLEAKGPLILHMIEQRVEQRLGPKHLQIALQRIVAGSVPLDLNGKLKKDGDDKDKDNDDDNDDGDDGNQSVANNEDGGNSSMKLGQYQALSTSFFLNVVKSIAGAPGQDLCRSFLQTWIAQNGMPFFTVGFWYNRKQTQAEIVIDRTRIPGREKFVGNIKITIVEEQSEYVYFKRIESDRHKWEFPCHSKVRKKRRIRQKLYESDDEYEQSNPISGPGMGLNDTPVYWVKIDPECGWLRHIVMYQPDFNWMEQLLSDSKCIRSRVQAARNLALHPTSWETIPERPPPSQSNDEKTKVGGKATKHLHAMACRVLTECMHGLTTHSRRLRAEAAIALGLWQSLHATDQSTNTNGLQWKGMRNLFRIFKEHFFDRNADMPLPNYFLPSGGKVVLESVEADEESKTNRDIQIQDYAEGEYEIKKVIPKALTLIRIFTGFSPPEIETFLLQLLKQNDNSKNYVEMADESSVAEDCFYLGSLIISLSMLVLEKRGGNIETSQEILRLLHFDDVSSSYNYTITVCCLEALCNLELAGRLHDNIVP